MCKIVMRFCFEVLAQQSAAQNQVDSSTEDDMAEADTGQEAESTGEEDEGDGEGEGKKGTQKRTETSNPSFFHVYSIICT